MNETFNERYTNSKAVDHLERVNNSLSCRPFKETPVGDGN